jgi:hypothetical protein
VIVENTYFLKALNYVNISFLVKQLDSVEFYEMNGLNESLSMNVFWVQGMAFMPDKAEPNIDRESDTLTYTGVHCLDVNFQMGDTLPLLS